MQCSQVPLQYAPHTSPPKMRRKSEQVVMLVRAELLRKASWCTKAPLVSEPAGSAWVWLRAGVTWVIRSSQAGRWKQASHKISTAPLLNCLCIAPGAMQMHPRWFYICCPGFISYIVRWIVALRVMLFLVFGLACTLLRSAALHSHRQTDPSDHSCPCNGTMKDTWKIIPLTS